MSELIRQAARMRMLDIMLDLSESCYCASWMSCLEYDLWEIIHHKKDKGYGMASREGIASEPAELDALSVELGGWWAGEDEWFELDNWKVEFDRYIAERNAKYNMT